MNTRPKPSSRPRRPPANRPLPARLWADGREQGTLPPNVWVTDEVRRVAPPGGQRVSVGEARVFGAVLIEQRRVMKRLVGDEVFARGLGLVEPERRDEYEALTLLGWCRASTAIAVTRAVALASGRVPEAFVRDVVVGGFGMVLRTVWRILMTNSTDEALVRRAGTLYAKTVDKGVLDVTQHGPGHVVLEVTGWPEMDDLDIVALSAGVEAALLAAGRSGIRVAGERTRSGARLSARTGRESERPAPEV